MARYKRSPGWCEYCERRVWVSRLNHFFTTWRCEECGSKDVYVGERLANVAAETALGEAGTPPQGTGFCSRCGAGLYEDAAFCAKCGAQVV